jgi:hypothetical protein
MDADCSMHAKIYRNLGKDTGEAIIRSTKIQVEKVHGKACKFILRHLLLRDPY